VKGKQTVPQQNKKPQYEYKKVTGRRDLMAEDLNVFGSSGWKCVGWRVVGAYMDDYEALMMRAY